MTITKREAAFRELEKLVGASETTGPNRGPIVDKIEAADTLAGIGYSYCQSTENYTWFVANDELLAGGTASVWQFYNWANDKGYKVTRPLRYDHVTYDFGEGSGGPYDHVGQVEKVLRLGPVLIIRTIEGNTSPSNAGSQSNGGGIYRKTRTVKASSVAFFRVPGECPHPYRYMKQPRVNRLATLRGWFGARRKGGWSWTRIKATTNWREYKAKGGK
jgi:hypothetical protein